MAQEMEEKSRKIFHDLIAGMLMNQTFQVSPRKLFSLRSRKPAPGQTDRYKKMEEKSRKIFHAQTHHFADYGSLKTKSRAVRLAVRLALRLAVRLVEFRVWQVP